MYLLAQIYCEEKSVLVRITLSFLNISLSRFTLPFCPRIKKSKEARAEVVRQNRR